MANPSLQIGNDNWAIKEDNLLGYSTAGSRFVPQPITMTRATLGTRVNPSGLVEDVALLGSEEVTNGDFATDSNWTKETGWTISGGTANYSGGTSNRNIRQAIGVTNGKTYKIQYQVTSITSGEVACRFGGMSGIDEITATTVGTYVGYITANSSVNGELLFEDNDNNFIGSIDNVSVKEATIDNLPRVDYTDGTSSLLVEPQRTNVFIQNDISTWNGFSSYADETTAPDGTTIDFVNMEDRRIFPTTTISNSTEYTSSIYLKGNKTANVKLRNTAANDTVITLSTEWQRFELTATSVSTITNALLIDARYGQGMGAAGLEIAIYGGQVEEGSYATSYIPTSGSTVTRNQETYTKTGISDLINSTEGVLFAEWKPKISSDYNFISINNGTSNEIVTIGKSNDTTTMFVGVRTTSVFQMIYTSSSHDLTIFNKVAVKWKSGDMAVWVNGVEVLTDTSTNIPTGMNELSFDFSGTNTFPFFGKVKQLQVFKTALSDSELATLTT